MPSPPFPAWNYRREYENPYDNDFLSIEDLVYGFTRYASSDDDDDEEDEEPRNNNKHLNCPVCKTRHEFVPPSGSPRSTTGSSAATAEQYSHHARVIYASFACPICLEDQAGPPMVCLPCGHAVCEKDFRLLGGSTSDAAEDTRVRQENEVVTNEHQRGNINNSNTTHGASEEEVEYVSMALMHAFAQRLMHEAEEEAAARRQTRVETSERTTSNAGDDEYLHDFGEEEDSYEHDYCPVLQLMDYHDNNAEEYDKPPAEGFPKTGIWLLVPDVTTDDLSLMYYCDHPHQSNAEDDDYEPVYFIEQFPRGTKLIPNGPHGVYVYAPEYEGSMVWDIFYVKNIPPRKTVRDPVFKFEIPKHSMCVPDGRGGIYALCPKDHIPNHNNESQSGTRPGNSSNTTRGNRNNPQEDYRLMRYWNRRRYGALIEDALPASSQLFMEKTGGVILLRRDNDSNFSSLWHLSAPNRRLLLYRGISKHARVVGDVTGTSVIILTTGGRLASILTRVAVNREVDGAYTSSIVFSYDLDIPLDAIKDIVDDASDPTRVFLHCRRRDNSGRNNWKVCRVSSSNDEGVTVEDIYICAKNSRVLSDKEHGIWVWKKPTRDANCARDRGFVHVKGDSTTWTSPLIFPPGTLLGGLPFR